MKYNFDQQIDRRGTYSLKWEVPERELPMWVAGEIWFSDEQRMDDLLHRNRPGNFQYCEKNDQNRRKDCFAYAGV